MVCSSFPYIGLGTPFFRSVYVGLNSEEDQIGLGRYNNNSLIIVSSIHHQEGLILGL
jgi:hypothetical protein